MKKSMMLLAFIAVLALFTACTKNQGGFSADEEGTVVIRIDENGTTEDYPRFHSVLELQTPRMNSPDIVLLQTRLIQLGFDEIGEADGYYGPVTEGVVKKIQYYSEFEPNGKVNQKEWYFLLAQSNAAMLTTISDGTIFTPESDFETDKMGTITVYKGPDKGIIIPAQIKGVAVTAIEKNVFEKRGLPGITIPEGITSIGEGAFFGNRLNSVIIPTSVTSIGVSAFRDNQLTSITIGANVKLGNERYSYFAFEREGDFDNFYIENGKKAGTYVLNGKQWSLTTIIPEQNTGDFTIDSNRYTIPPESDIEIDRIGTITNYKVRLFIPPTIGGKAVTAIGDEVFNSKRLESVVIPDGVTSIGDGAFSYCGLKYIAIPKSVTSIGNYAFEGNNLTNITIPDGIISIGRSAFFWNRLESVTISESVSFIGAYALGGASSITIGANVTLEESPPYYRYQNANDFTIFYNHNGKKAGTYVLSNSLWSLDGKTIRDYDKTENGFTIDYRGTLIAGEVRGASLVIPAQVGGTTVKAIGEDLFIDKGLSSVTIPAGVTLIGSRSFRDNPLTTVTIGADANLLAFFIGDPPNFDYHYAFGLTFYYCYSANKKKAGTYEHSNNTWSMNGETIVSYEQIKIDKNEREVIAIINREGMLIAYRIAYTDVIIPEHVGGIPVTGIGEYVFENSIINLTIPSSVTFISPGAFYPGSPDIVTIGANVTVAGGMNPSIKGGFDSFYNLNGKKAGIYMYNNGKWSFTET